MTQVI